MAIRIIITFYSESSPSISLARFKAEDIGKYLYKIRDNSIRPRHFLSIDNADEIEAILSDCEGYSLHEFIDRDELLWPIIDFDLSQERYLS
ncbi:13016_t:CDS:2 [Funneliformis geosporum]|uniref:13016_t:CDS:1 n=1 Tax=Funneliformis geosporum TaxID=1117311 RepID=A0A9W4WW31_9GLOM|nr:13016_t:CDS:2 [Funneliformis geosporum]